MISSTMRLFDVQIEWARKKYIQFTVWRLIRREFKAFFRLARALEMLARQEMTKVHWNYGQMHFYSANIQAQTLYKLESISTLVGKGLTVDAWPLLRSLIETSLDHDYILRNPSKLDLYFQYSTYLDLRFIERLEITRPLSPDQQKEREQLKALWESNKHLFLKNGRIRDTWRDKSLEEIGREVKLVDIHSVMYREANDYVHGNSNLIRSFIVGKNEEGLLLKAGGTYEKRDLILITSLTLVLVYLVFMRANKYFELGFDREVQKLNARIVKYHLSHLEKPL